jgi:hypothetical protein
MHLNIQSLPSKFDNLKIMLYRMQDIGKRLDFILLCETFLTMTNAHMFNIDGCNFVCYNRKNSSRGVLQYIYEITLIILSDLILVCVC